MSDTLLNLEQEFAKLLDKSSSVADFDVGQIIKGKLVQYEKDGALVDIGSKAEAFLASKEVVNREDDKKITDVFKELIHDNKFWHINHQRFLLELVIIDVQ